MGPPDSNRVSRAPPYLGVEREVDELRVRACHLLWGGFPAASTAHQLCHSLAYCTFGLLNPATPTRQRRAAMRTGRFGLFPVRSPLLGESRSIYFPAVTEMFHFTAFALAWWLIGPPGCPIRKSTAQSLAYSSPLHIAVRHVLRRLLMPRHPPCALCSFFAVLASRDATPIPPTHPCCQVLVVCHGYRAGRQLVPLPGFAVVFVEVVSLLGVPSQISLHRG